jgi:hypothetical protein
MTRHPQTLATVALACAVAFMVAAYGRALLTIY